MFIKATSAICILKIFFSRILRIKHGFLERRKSLPLAVAVEEVMFKKPFIAVSLVRDSSGIWLSPLLVAEIGLILTNTSLHRAAPKHFGITAYADHITSEMCCLLSTTRASPQAGKERE